MKLVLPTAFVPYNNNPSKLFLPISRSLVTYNSFSFSDNIFECEGSIDLLDEYPLLFFNCSINSNNKRELLKEVGINIKKKDNGPLKIYTKGNLNIISNKINFKEISMNENYKASNEDLNYFKNKFENILLKDKFDEILSLKKIKEFILEIS